MQYPPLSPPHGTSLGTTAGITAVIALVAAVSVLGQSAGLAGIHACLGGCSVLLIVLGAGGLYTGRNFLGHALDCAAAQEPGTAGVAAAQGMMWFHLGMAGVFAGSGLAAAFRMTLPQGGLLWLVPAAAAALALLALGRAAGWRGEALRRKGKPDA